MKNDLIIFESPEFGEIRTVLEKGEPWFVAADVCRALDIKNNRDALTRLDEDEKHVGLTDTNRGNREATFVNECGLYSLILSCRKPEAKSFKRWVTHEVIPSIRKYGAYMTDSVLEEMETHPEAVAAYVKMLKKENEKAKAARAELAMAKLENAMLKPKAEYYDTFVNPGDLTCFSYTAKEIGVELTKLVGYLLEHGFVYRDRHRDGRLFARAGKRNSLLFRTKDFYLNNGKKSEYTLVTPIGKAYFYSIRDKIRKWEPYDPETGEAQIMMAVFPV